MVTALSQWRWDRDMLGDTDNVGKLQADISDIISFDEIIDRAVSSAGIIQCR